VLGGGNVDGIFAGAGAAKALLEQGDDFELLAGTSAGALVATAIAAGKLHRIEELIDTLLPRDLIRNDGPLADLRRARRLLRKGHALSATPLWELLEREFPDATLDAIPAGRVAIATFDLRRRHMFAWSPAIGASRYRAALFASMSIPFVTASVLLEAEGARYELVDGGVTATHPVQLVLPALWKAKQQGEPAELVVASTLHFKPEEEIPRRGLKRIYRIVKSIKGGFVTERSNSEFDAAEEIGIRQRWIQIATENLEVDDFTREEIRQAFDDGYRAVRSAATAVFPPIAS
jgi:predicted acylesterase/phospholipase RssA